MSLALLWLIWVGVFLTLYTYVYNDIKIFRDSSILTFAFTYFCISYGLFFLLFISGFNINQFSIAKTPCVCGYTFCSLFKPNNYCATYSKTEGQRQRRKEREREPNSLGANNKLKFTEALVQEKYFNTDKWKWFVKISYFYIYIYKRTIQ